MPNYQPYSPDQAELLPAHVKDVLGADHLCFVVHEVVESCDLSVFEKQEEDAGGQRPYDPRMMLKIWLYGFGVNVRTTRKLEQRIREDLGFRYLAGGATPDHKTLSEFHRRHRDAITAMFTEVLLFLRRAGMARLGTVAIDSTRVKGSASPDRLLRRDQIERELADCGFFSNQNLREMEIRGIEAYVPDPNLARELNTGKTARGVGRMTVSDAHLQRSRKRLRTARGRAWYKKRKGLVEPVIGTLKEQRGMRQFQRRGRPATAVEWALASMAYNLIRYRSLRHKM